MAQSKINPMDGFYSWGYIGGSTILISKGEQIKEKIEGAFDSIEIKEDEETPALDYVLKVNGNEQGRIVIPVDMVVKDAYYDDETKEVVIVVRVGEDEEKEIRFSVADLIDVYSGDEVTIHMEDKVFSISEDVMNKFDTLEGAISDEQTRAEAAEQANADAITKVESDYQAADNTLKEELEEELSEKTKDMVEWEYSTEDRKHIVLDNHSNILGKSTDGGSYNLAMVSKWDVADFGSNQLPLNLNAKDGKVTINDDKAVATIDDATNLVNEEKERAEAAEQTNATAIAANETAIGAEKERAEAAEQANADAIAENKSAIEANTDAISKVEADYQTADAELEEKFTEKTKNMVEWQYSTEERKHIVLGNHENMLGTATNGSTYNIAMVSKWDVADFGSSQLPLNLNAKDGKVTVNDNDEVITTKNVIPLSAIEDLFK